MRVHLLSRIHRTLVYALGGGLGFTPQPTGLEGSASKIWFPVAQTHTQRSTGAHVSTIQKCFENKMGDQELLVTMLCLIRVSTYI